MTAFVTAHEQTHFGPFKVEMLERQPIKKVYIASAIYIYYMCYTVTIETV